jgi:L-threonylcarbamoyladenylate synthase
MTALVHSPSPNPDPDTPAADPAIRPWPIRRAAQVLRQGGIIAYPTESVFGLGCNPFNPNAVYYLLALKNRPVSKGLILISDSFARLQPLLAPIPEDRLEIVLRSWPGPVTWVMPARSDVPEWLRGRHSSLAVRVTAHPLAAALCAAADMPLVSTSANLSRRPPARNALQARIRCDNRIDFILPGATGGLTRPTQIRDALDGRLLRQ